LSLFRTGGLLERASLYNLSQRLVGKAHVYRAFVGEYLRPPQHARILDLACGTGELLGYLPDVSYLGIDISGDYIESASRRYAGRAQFVRGDLRQVTVPPGSFDLVVAVGVLHHLDDATAATVVGLAKCALRSEGRFVLLEPCRRKGQPLVARMVIAMDRGEHVRDRDGYTQILRPFFGDIRSTVRDDLLVVPSTQVILECRADAGAGSNTC
jgi:SAM-dependent methyltransferase